jgi:hypothetical protein
LPARRAAVSSGFANALTSQILGNRPKKKREANLQFQLRPGLARFDSLDPQPTTFNHKRLSVEFCKPFYKEAVCLICRGNSGYPGNIPRHYKAKHLDTLELYWKTVSESEADPIEVLKKLVNPTGTRQQSVSNPLSPDF